MRASMRGIPRIRKGDMVKVVWRDACEGLGGPNLSDLEKSTLQQIVYSTATTVGRYLRAIGPYLLLREVLREESDEGHLYEKRPQAKCRSIPLAVTSQVLSPGTT